VEGSGRGLRKDAISAFAWGGLKKTTKNLSHDSRFLGRDLNWELPNAKQEC
jgi:hypothetical protein